MNRSTNITQSDSANLQGPLYDLYETESSNPDDLYLIRTIAATVWLLLTCTGLLGNGVVIFIIIKKKKLENVTFCYLLNLAITDIAFIISCVPFTAITFLMESWLFGRFLCIFSHFLTFVTVCATCLTLMTMTIDRCIYVCNTKRPSWRRPRFVLYVSIFIWLVSGVLSLPILFSYDVQTHNYYKDHNSTFYDVVKVQECVQKKKNFLIDTVHWYCLAISYVLPSIVLIICYFKIISFMSNNARKLSFASSYNRKSSTMKKKRVTKTVILLTSTFIILWFPVSFLSAWYRLDENFPKYLALFLLKLVAHTMSYANSTINPIIYAYSNELFRKNLFKFKCCFKKSNLSLNVNTDYHKSSTRRSHVSQNAAFDRTLPENSSLISR